MRVGVVCPTVACTMLTAAVGGLRQPAAPLDAVTTIVEAFRTHRVVALSEEHGDERAHAFRLMLIRDLRFPRAVSDILVEFGNSRYQEVIDRYVGGQPVAETDLRRVWQDTTIAHTIWDRPIYEDFYRAVREVNAGLAENRRLRVLLGDPPVDWQQVSTRDDLRRAAARRSSHPADVLIRERRGRDRGALVLYGGAHLWRQNLQGPNLIERFERATQERTFVVVSHPFANLEALGVDPAGWRAPRIALTKGSSLEGQLDAVLYLGPSSERTRSQLSTALCADVRYRQMRTRRMRLAGMEHAADVLEQECNGTRSSTGRSR